MPSPSTQTAPRADPAIVTLRPIGTPLPLAFLALCVASVAFSGIELHWVAATQGRVAGLVALLLAVPLQGIASIFGFLARDPVAGTGAGVLAGTWAVTGVVTVLSPPGSRSPELGILLVVAAATLIVPVIAGWTAKPLAAAVFALCALRFVLTGVSQLTPAPAWQTASGVAGLVLAGCAIYAALAFELEGSHHRTVLPIGRPRSAPTTDSPDTDPQDSEVDREAGVRRQL